MDWIKKNPEKFVLLLLSVALLAVAGLLVFNEQNFLKTFDPLKVRPFESPTLPPLETGAIKVAQDAVDKPATWQYDPEKQGSLFISQPYVVIDKDKTGATIPAPGNLGEPLNEMFYPPVPNKWLVKYHLNIMDPHVIDEDPDDDGWTTKEEFLAGTDPTDKNSHPPYATKLYLEQYISIPFLLMFMAQPDDTTFQIETQGQHTQILEMGAQIEGTRYKIVGFQKKETHDPQNPEMVQDVSELTVENTETGKKVVLVLNHQTNDPDSYALFRYFWKGSKVIKVKLNDNFTLDPEADITYKLIDITKDKATIQNLKTNQVIIIPPIKAGEQYHP